MSEQAGFLKAICLDPADDTARLAYADWLMEQDNEFDRARAEWFTEEWHKHRDDMNLYGGFLLTTPRDDGTHAVRMPYSGGCVIHRGLIESVSMSIEQFMKFAKPLFANQPIVRVTIYDKNPLPFNRRYLWHNSDHPMVVAGNYPNNPESPDHLPRAVFDLLTGNIAKKGNRVTEMVRSYKARLVAKEACSRACVDYGRFLVGLPRLYSKPVGAA